METALAIHEALIQANVPAPAARRVAESLEKDMTSNLATKQDLQHLGQLIATRLDAVNDRFGVMEDRISGFESRVALMMQDLESRLLVKLGGLMTVPVGVACTVVALLR